MAGSDMAGSGTGRHGNDPLITDHAVLNVLRRLWGHTPGQYRMMAEAKDAAGHYFSVYEIRATNETEAAARLRSHLAARNCELVDISDTKPARVPFARDAHVIQLSERVYMEMAL
ncbi:hypothetical protein ACS3SW_05325 [Roseobacteraceae bacterium S113]